VATLLLEHYNVLFYPQTPQSLVCIMYVGIHDRRQTGSYDTVPVLYGTGTVGPESK
jgi:hypothetical protein